MAVINQSQEGWEFGQFGGWRWVEYVQEGAQGATKSWTVIIWISCMSSIGRRNILPDTAVQLEQALWAWYVKSRQIQMTIIMVEIGNPTILVYMHVSSWTGLLGKWNETYWLDVVSIAMMDWLSSKSSLIAAWTVESEDDEKTWLEKLSWYVISYSVCLCTAGSHSGLIIKTSNHWSGQTVFVLSPA